MRSCRRHFGQRVLGGGVCDEQDELRDELREYTWQTGRPGITNAITLLTAGVRRDQVIEQRGDRGQAPLERRCRQPSLPRRPTLSQ